MLQNEITMPPNWYMVKVDTTTNLYFNIESGVATLAPVFHLSQTKAVLE